MSRTLAQCLLAVLLVLAFALQQTGSGRIYDTCCDESEGASVHADDCEEAGERGGCAPSCTDCSGCPGPARVLMSTRMPALGPPLARSMTASTLVIVAGRDPRLRLERPPRA